MTATPSARADERRIPAAGTELKPTRSLYLCVGLIAGAVIALQIAIMRIYAVGSWAHFGSLVVSLAMLGFGLTSAIMCIAKGWFERHWRGVAACSLLLFGPLAVGANLMAQQVPFNAIFLLSDPTQVWRLAANFVLYMLPFLAGALFLGTVFLKGDKVFGRLYFADLTGAGLCGLLFLVAMYGTRPEHLLVVPLLMWLAAGLFWFAPGRRRIPCMALLLLALITIGAHLALPLLFDLRSLAVSDYKGVAYARKFPDSRRVYESPSPFGHLEIYASSYLHFAPGLSDNAAFNLTRMPENAYLGMYIDGDGPIGIIRNLPPEETAYFRFLPMFYPYVLKSDPDTFVVQFGGGISTALGLRANSRRVTVAEGNRAVLSAFRNDPGLRAFTGDILSDPRVRVVDYDGRLYLANTSERYDVIDLSLADSAGLSNPGGFAITEKFAYTREAMLNYMRALKDGGILSVTLWNKEEPPKSVLKLYATMAGAARAFDSDTLAQSFFVASSYLSTATVLYKRGGFSAEEVEKLRGYTRAMSFDAIYYPGLAYDETQTAGVLENYRQQLFFDAERDANGEAGSTDSGGPPGGGPPPDARSGSLVPAAVLGQLAWHRLIGGGFDDLARDYVFDVRPLTNARPYFAAYVKPADLVAVLDRLELLQDEWGYLLLWATLGIACLAALPLVLLPLVFGWRTIFRRNPGKFRTIVYFACLGTGYIMVEVGLISEFMLALSNATVSAAILITGMLVSSGLGSFVSERTLARARGIMPVIFIAIGALLIGYGLLLDRVLDVVGTYSYPVRLLFCFGLIFPPAFLMGFPMPTAMTLLARLDKSHMFLWAWGINGCFSVIGAALVPLVAVSFGLATVLVVAGCAYLLALPAFFAVLLPLRSGAPGPALTGAGGLTLGGLALALGLIVPAPADAQSPQLAARTELVPFETAPFPYRGEIPGQSKPFLDVISGERRGHTSPRGGVYFEEPTYADRRVLLSVPAGFDAGKPALIVVYFHGNEATLARDVRDRQQVPRQLARSGKNAVLVAPQFAVNALDSSAGAFWQPGAFARFLDEATRQLPRLAGDARMQAVLQRAPVVLVAYSGGYNPAAFALTVGGAGERIHGVLLLDALFGELDRFADWIASRPPAFFVNGYGRASRAENGTFRRMLEARGITSGTSLPAALTPGTVAFVDAGDRAVHNDFVTKAWAADPLADLLGRIPGFARPGP